MSCELTKIAATTAATTTTRTMRQKVGEQSLPSLSSSSFYNSRRLKLCTPAEIEHCETSKTIVKYIEAKTIQDKNTAITYKTTMQSFAQFVYRRYNKTPVDDFLKQIKAGKYDPYDILTEYSGFLRDGRPTTENKLTANVIRARVKTVRKFFRFNKILVTVEDFNELVPLPRKEQPPKKGIDKTDVSRYLNACKNIQLKTSLHVMASNGPRPIELCAVRECDVNLDSDPATITYRAEYSKMRVARTRPLTREATTQLRLWDTFKYRRRWTTVNYTLFNQKITFDFLKSHLWAAADILRGSLDPADYRQPIMTLLFIKRLNDTFEENPEKLIKEEGKSEKEAYGNKNRHYFFIPKEARWSILSQTSENIGEKIDHVCRIIERENPDLDGVLTNTTYNDKRKFPDDRLRKLISHFNSPRLANSDLESTDIFGDAFEYLLEQFADETKKSGGNFFTPKEIVRLLVNLVEPKEGMSICDPTCGSGGMLIESMKYVSQHGGNPRNLILEGQEGNYGTLGMCKMNMVLHGLVDFGIEYGDTLSNPKLVEGGRLKTYDKVLANFPFSMNWDNM
jgi:integrase